MNPVQRLPQRRRQAVRRAVVLMPNGLTLFNLFCGVYAIIVAMRGNFSTAAAFIVVGGIADMLDGRVARATNTGSRFGEELDSLVDAISFGFAPAMITYIWLQQLPNHGSWEWLLVFIFTSCAVMRLARFNVEQAGRKKTHFHGLPSPAAGLTLATYYWFSQTPLYNQTIILFTDSKTLSDLPWHVILRGLMAILAALMISDVPYPTVPSIGFGSVRRILGTLMVAGCVVLLVIRKEEFIFPALLAYVAYGAIKWVVLGFLGRSHSPSEIYGADLNATTNGESPPPTRSGWRGGGSPISVATSVGEPRRDDGKEERGEERERARSDEGSSRSSRRKRRRRGRGGNRPTPPTPGVTPPSPTPPDTPTGPAE
jgi:CDP-diacylglycerol---serine O-phosphatidyltransferase